MILSKYKPFLLAVSIPVLFSLLLITIFPLFSALPFAKLWYGIIGTLCAYITIHIVKKLDQNPLEGFSLRFDGIVLSNFFRGLLLGLVVAGVMIGTQILYSDMTMTFHQGNVYNFLLMSISILPLAFMEELAFKSYGFVKLNKEYGVWTAQIVMAILFALYHFAGGWSLLTSFAGPGTWALAFGLLALISGGVSMPTGFHSGLNFVLATIGGKAWIPALWTFNFSTAPTEEMVQSNSNFGLAQQIIMLIVLIFMTWRYTKRNRAKGN